MAKGRPRTPTALLELSGGAQRNAARLKRQGRGSEPKPDPVIGTVPRRLNDTQKEIWREVMSEIPPQVATKADRRVVEIAVRMIEKMQHIHSCPMWTKDKCGPYCPGDMRSADYTTLSRCLSQLGMTPADRSKIQVTPQESTAAKADPWAEFESSGEDVEATQ